MGRAIALDAIHTSNLSNKEKGITLIALIITIIVLLILAGVSIATLIGDNGTLERAIGARETIYNSISEEEGKLSQYENEIDNLYQISRGGSAEIETILEPRQYSTETTIQINSLSQYKIILLCALDKQNGFRASSMIPIELFKNGVYHFARFDNNTNYWEAKAKYISDTSITCFTLDYMAIYGIK